MDKKLVEAQLLLLVYSEIRQLLVFSPGDCARFSGRYPCQLNDSVPLPGNVTVLNVAASPADMVKAASRTGRGSC